MNKVVITGADGFVGSAAAAYFLQNGIAVLALDLAEKPARLVPHPKLVYKQCDCSEQGAFAAAIPAGEYDTLLHFAWAGSAGEARADYVLQMQNALTTVACMKTAKERGCTRFVCAGSIMETEAEAAVRAQGNKPGAGYIYGIGKQTAHSLCKTVAAQLGIELVWAMITNAYGAGELSPRFVNTTIRKILRGEALQFTAATQNYDFVYITDVARAFYLIAQNGKPFCNYLIGSCAARPLKEFIYELVEALDPQAQPVFGDIPFTGTNLPLAAFDATPALDDCGFRAEISFAAGARMTRDWLKNHIATE
ncbi:MAG: NAD-dependent epimerase/dehydratase family protein [Oscillospiraceae bacterium]